MDASTRRVEVVVDGEKFQCEVVSEHEWALGVKSVYVRPPPIAGGKRYRVVREINDGTYLLRIIERGDRFGFAVWQSSLDMHAVSHKEPRARQEPRLPDPLPHEKVEDADKELRRFVREITPKDKRFPVPLTFAEIAALEQAVRKAASHEALPPNRKSIESAVAALQKAREENGG